MTKMTEYVEDMRDKKMDTADSGLEGRTSADDAKDVAMLSPQDIIEEINRQFDEAIIVTDVGQHQMLLRHSMSRLLRRSSLLTSGGLGTMGYGFPGAIGAKIGNPDKTGYRYFRGWRHADEYPGICDRCSGRTSADPLCI